METFKKILDNIEEPKLFEVMVPEGALILTPYQTKEEVVKMFNNWLNKTYDE